MDGESMSDDMQLAPSKGDDACEPHDEPADWDWQQRNIYFDWTLKS
jgi:hypothetical protein